MEILFYKQATLCHGTNMCQVGNCHYSLETWFSNHKKLFLWYQSMGPNLNIRHSFGVSHAKIFTISLSVYVWYTVVFKLWGRNFYSILSHQLLLEKYYSTISFVTSHKKFATVCLDWVHSRITTWKAVLGLG